MVHLPGEGLALLSFRVTGRTIVCSQQFGSLDVVKNTNQKLCLHSHGGGHACL